MPPEDKEQDGNEKKNNFSAGNLFHKGKQKSKTSERADKNSNKNKKQSIQWWRDLTRAEKVQIIGLLLTFFTLIAFIVISSVQITLTNQALQRADTSNSYVRQSIEETRKNAKIEMRAYINVLEANIEGFKVNNRPHIILDIENSGNTPAYDVKVITAFKPGGTGVYDSDWVDSTKMVEGEIAYFIGAKRIFQSNHFPERYVSKEDSIGWRSGNRFLAFYGYIFYKDIFDEKHFTQFCMVYKHWAKKFILYPKYNKADSYTN